jgi:putative ABC transport system substrate-binding protein
MRRRDFITLLGGVAASPLAAHAQQPEKVYRVGFLSPVTPFAENSEGGAAFLRAMAERGYALGRNLTIERRAAMGRTDNLPQLAQELLAAKVDVIITMGYPTTLAARAIGIPTVVVDGVSDPVATGLIKSLARPGSNVTGISEFAPDLSTKRLALLKELAPQLHRVAMLWNQDDPAMTLRYRASGEAAERLGVTVQALGLREPNDFEAAFARMRDEKPDAILMVNDGLTVVNSKRVFDFALQHRVPAIYERKFLVREGGLMGYGPDLTELFERAAALVDRILKGAKPSDLPFEQPTRYTFTINLKTAKAMGLEVPPILLARADEVIE